MDRDCVCSDCGVLFRIRCAGGTFVPPACPDCGAVVFSVEPATNGDGDVAWVVVVGHGR